MKKLKLFLLSLVCVSSICAQTTININVAVYATTLAYTNPYAVTVRIDKVIGSTHTTMAQTYTIGNGANHNYTFNAPAGYTFDKSTLNFQSVSGTLTFNYGSSQALQVINTGNCSGAAAPNRTIWNPLGSNNFQIQADQRTSLTCLNTDINQYFTLLLKADGTVTSFGQNNAGQLGRGTVTAYESTPAAISGLTNIVAVSTGVAHAMVLNSSGQVYCWGQDCGGACGQGSNRQTFTTPQLVSIPGFVVAIAAGRRFCLALTSTGQVYSWGTSYSGELGHGISASCLTLPALIPGLSGVKAISAGANMSMFLLSSGQIMACGDELTIGDGTGQRALYPTFVSGITNAVAVTCGQIQTMALLADGTVKAWGAGVDDAVSSGPLMFPAGVNCLIPQTPTVLINVVGKDIATGCTSLYCLTAAGNIITLSGGNAGATPAVTGVVDIQTSCDAHNTKLVYANGDVTIFGENSYGQLGYLPLSGYGVNTITGSNLFLAANTAHAYPEVIPTVPTSCNLTASGTPVGTSPATGVYAWRQVSSASPSGFLQLSNSATYTTMPPAGAVTSYISTYTFQNSSEPMCAAKPVVADRSLVVPRILMIEDGLNQSSIENKVTVYPNPVGNQLNFTLQANENDNISIAMYDIQGRCLPSIKIAGKAVRGENIFQSDLSALTPGMYFYKIIVNNNASYSGKIIKE